MEGLLMEAHSDESEAVLGGSQMYHLALCSFIAVPKWQCYRLVTLFFLCFWSCVCGLRCRLN